jgi:hypothetical protein
LTPIAAFISVPQLPSDPEKCAAMVRDAYADQWRQNAVDRETQGCNRAYLFNIEAPKYGVLL